MQKELSSLVNKTVALTINIIPLLSLTDDSRQLLDTIESDARRAIVAAVPHFI